MWIAGLATLGVILTLGALHRPGFERLSFLVFDAYQRILPRPEAGAPIAIVDIDEASIAALGQWPWPRTTIAAMVERLSELGAVTIAFDIVFPEADRTSLEALISQLRQAGIEVTPPAGAALQDNDARLAQAFAASSVTVGVVISNETDGVLPPPKAGFSYGGADPLTYLPAFRGGVVNLPGLTEAATGLGSFSFPPSADGIVRTIPLVSAAQGRLYPSLGIEALRVAQGAANFLVRSTGASGEADTGRPAMAAVRAGALEVPTGANGELWVYYSGLPSLMPIPAGDLLVEGNDAALAERVSGRIVLIGTSAVGLRDLVATPAGTMAGVYVHAEIIDQIVGQVFLSRPDWAAGAELLAAAVLGLVLIGVAQRGSALVSTAAAIVLAFAALGLSWFAFAGTRLLIDPLLAAVAVAAVFAVTMPLLLLLTDRERQFVRNAFARYLAPSLVDRLADSPEALKLGGELRELTVLFSDIRGFTSLSEAMPPVELTALLNRFLTPMTDVLLKADATIDKYMGDAIMAFWNAPLSIAGHERKACLAALEMTRALEQLNATLPRPILIGIGLNSGPCCVGNLGSAQRFSYSAIGDGVNVASRLEALTKEFGLTILVSASTREAAGDLAFLEVDEVQVKGRAESVRVFALLGDDAMAATAEFAALSAAHDRLLAARREGRAEAVSTALAEASRHGGPMLSGLYARYRQRGMTGIGSAPAASGPQVAPPF